MFESLYQTDPSHGFTRRDSETPAVNTGMLRVKKSGRTVPVVLRPTPLRPRQEPVPPHPAGHLRAVLVGGRRNGRRNGSR
jgi:hypothetical protein